MEYSEIKERVKRNLRLINSVNKKTFIASSVLFILGLIFFSISTTSSIRYRKQSEKQLVRMENLFNEQIKEKELLINSLQNQKDSLAKETKKLYIYTIKKDSINSSLLNRELKKLNNKYEKDIDYINNLSADSNLLLLSIYLNSELSKTD